MQYALGPFDVVSQRFYEQLHQIVAYVCPKELALGRERIYNCFPTRLFRD